MQPAAVLFFAFKIYPKEQQTMRVQLVPPGTGELTYEIRNIVNVAEKLQKCGVTINWENIGDPIVKGEQIPAWMKQIVADAVMQNEHLELLPYPRRAENPRVYLQSDQQPWQRTDHPG